MLQSLTAAIREAGATHGWKSCRRRARPNCAAWSLAAISASIGCLAAFTSTRRSGSSRAQRSAICRSPARLAAIRRGSAAPPRRSRRSAGLRRKGCAGVDILAYRATEAEPLDLVAACRRGFPDSGAVVVAGSVNSPDRVAAVRAAGADAFTIGTAAIDGSYAPGAGPLAAQLGAILVDCGATE